MKQKKFKKPLKYALVVSTLFLGACQHESGNFDKTLADNLTSKTTTFSDYLQYIKTLNYEEYAASHKELEASKSEFKKMTTHILEMYEGVEVAHSYRMDDGRMCDCIPIMQQPGLRRKGGSNQLEVPPSFDPSSESMHYEQNTSKNLSLDDEVTNHEESIAMEDAPFDENGNKRQCEKGFIPMIRLNIDRMTSFSSLDDFFHKCPNRDCFLGDDSDAKINIQRRYAYIRNSSNNRGGSSWLNVWKPQTPRGQNSISQQWYSGRNSNLTQTVEGGWLVYSNQTPELFIYHTTGGYQPRTGCYNMDCQGFVQIDNHWTLGRSLNSISQTGSSQYAFRMRWYKNGTSGPWWLWLEGYDKGAGRWIGYYPADLYGSGTMASHASEVLFGGEVSYDNDVSSQSLEMGSGADASAGWTRAAYQRSIFYTNTSNNHYWMNTAAARETHPSCYTLRRTNSSGSWGTYFYFGGDACN